MLKHAIYAMLGLSLPFAASAQESAAFGKWTMTRDVSALDGRETLMATLESKGKIIDPIGNKVSAYLILSCIDGKPSTSIRCQGFLGFQTVEVSWRADSSKIRRESWLAQRGAFGILHQPFADRSKRMRDAISESSELVIRVEGYQSTQDAVFETYGSNGVIEILKNNCP